MPHLIAALFLAVLLGACTTPPAVLEAMADPCPESDEHYHPEWPHTHPICETRPPAGAE